MPHLPNPRYMEQWLDHLTSKAGAEENKSHFWGKDPSCLIKNSSIGPGKFTVGNGEDLYASTVIPALHSAKYEIIFVTCFWACSSALDQLSATLVKLSDEGCARPRDEPKLRVHLCFSSFSLTQKLFHTSSASGHTFPPSKWSSLGLPSPDMLDGLDLQVKSLFFLPFSVMHPKFVIVDRQHALLPSCNLSYESWLECCLLISGPAVAILMDFWQNVWGRNDLPALPSKDAEQEPSLASAYKTTLLPSPHHRSPRFRLFSASASPPPTPLNTYLLNLFVTASRSISLLTPNFTSLPVISALLDALQRGVDVTIITNRRMMVLEQLLTAGAITEFCVWKFRRRFRNLVTSRRKSTASNIEEGRSREVGSLRLGYFAPDSHYAKSHIKCTIVDEETVVLGSGNMDRASWYTSQELGIALEGAEVVRFIWQSIDKELNGRDCGGVEWL